MWGVYVHSIKTSKIAAWLMTCLLILEIATPAAAQILAAKPENDIAGTAMGVPLVWNNPDFFSSNGLGLTGTGQIIGVADTGLGSGKMDDLHVDLKDKIIGVKDYSGDGWDDPFGHGTHIAASIVGSGEKSGGRLKGIAPGAQLYFQAAHERTGDTLKIPDVYDLLADAYDNGVRIHSNSWGVDETGGEYDKQARSLDEFVWEHPDMLVLKSAGNFADGASPMVTSPGAAKNAITVGATESPRGIDSDSDNPYQVASFSSRGTEDGRIKPDLVAPGSWVLSASQSSSYAYLSGTSMANAMATGAAALTRQYFTDVEKIKPSAALIKAALIYGAKELPGEPRQNQGFGMIDLQASLMPLSEDAAWFLDGIEIKTGGVYRYKFTSDGQAPLRAALVWNDYPNQSGEEQALVNDLDLKIITPDGRELWGNNVVGGDRKNNVEVLTLKTPAAGDYIVEVKGTKVVEGPQQFSIIYGETPLRGVVKQTAEGVQVKAIDGTVLPIDPQLAVQLVKDNKLEDSVPVSELPAETSVYYLPQQFGSEGKLAGLYDVGYAVLTGRLILNRNIVYQDTENHWAEEVIAEMSQLNMVGGFPDGTFRPDEQVTRAQFAAMLVRAMKMVESPSDAAEFYDVPADSWFRGAVGAAVNAGLVVGYTEHTFAPNDPVTREQMAVMAARALYGGKTPYSSEDTTLERYTDLEQISLWARPAVSLAVQSGLISGRAEDRFAPQNTTTRAEAAAVLERILDEL